MFRLLIIITVILLMPVLALAQIQEVNATLAMTLQLNKLKKQLIIDKAQLDSFKITSKATTLALKSEQSTLAKEVLNLEISRLSTQKEMNTLNNKFSSMNQTHKVLTQSIKAFHANTLSAIESTKNFLNEVPASQLQISELTEINLNNITSDELIVLLNLMVREHHRATTISITRKSLYIADGTNQKVELLQVGHFAYAYRTIENNQISLAIKSPKDASGFRWQEDLPTNVITGLNNAFNTIKQKSHYVSIPVDVTKTISLSSIITEQSLQSHLKSGGIVMVPLLLVALIALFLIIERFIILTRARENGQKLLAKTLHVLENDTLDIAIAGINKNNSIISKTFMACLHEGKNGPEAMENAIETQLLHEVPILHRRLGGIMALGAVAPLLGLLGTVTGIISAFGAIKELGNISPALMAGGISQALITTEVGLVIAIIVLLLHRVLQGQVEKILADAEKHTATLFNTLNLKQAS